MSLASELAAVSYQILREFGAPGTLTRNAEGAYAAATTDATLTTTNTDVQAAVFDYETKYIDGERILQGDRQGLIAARANTVAVPKLGDKLTWSPPDQTAEQYFIVAVKRIGIAGIQVIYDCQLRA